MRSRFRSSWWPNGCISIGLPARRSRCRTTSYTPSGSRYTTIRIFVGSSISCARSWTESARRTQICAATSFLALSRSNSPFSKPPIRPEEPRSSVHAVKSQSAACQHTALGSRRGALQPRANHVGRAGEEPIGMRIICRPHDLLGADKIGQHPEARLHRLERDPAVALEQFTGPRSQAGIVEELVVEMAVHTVEPSDNPAAA